MINTKTCIKCEVEKDLTVEYFGKIKDKKDGFNNICKTCKSKYNKQYIIDNKERLTQYQKENYEKNKESLLKEMAIYREKNREKLTEYARQYWNENREKAKASHKRYRDSNKVRYAKMQNESYMKNRENILSKQKQYYNENSKKILAQQSRYGKANPQISALRWQRRRARKENLPSTLTQQQWIKIKDDFNNSCCYCGLTEEESYRKFNEQLHQEHFVPLTSGGGYTHNNIIPACRSCNSSKNNQDFFDWYPIYEHYDECREKFILEYLGYVEDTQQLSIL